ncbi:hypothetical protein GG804_13095 [Sphingomonas histidinilytica]|uniref:hypothetical protein n=1 Tax=Rhizorhabdus histidinilytica TaxID=439228 RepID=UPI001ADB0A51|nr:hypothetical protein [Rhizorhabdus histidinilytica]MBO9377706.1 hypothetical protein [Rhizorhabdus histidinilytica]
MIVRSLIAVAALALTACQRPLSADPDASAKLDAGRVARAAVAPDGTTLWVTRWGGRLVFFAASGTSWQTQRTQTTGKTTTTITEDHAVPTGDGIEAASRAWSE